MVPNSRPVYTHLRRSPQTHLAPGATSGEEQRLSNAQASLALRHLRPLQANLNHRPAVAQAYQAELAALGFSVPQPPAKAEPAFVRYPLWVEDRAAAAGQAAFLVVLGRWFDSVLEEAESPAYGGYEMGTCPRAEAAPKHLVNLPTHPRVSAWDVDAIVWAVTRATDGVKGQ